MIAKMCFLMHFRKQLLNQKKLINAKNQIFFVNFFCKLLKLNKLTAYKKYNKHVIVYNNIKSTVKFLVKKNKNFSKLSIHTNIFYKKKNNFILKTNIGLLSSNEARLLKKYGTIICTLHV